MAEGQAWDLEPGTLGEGVGFLSLAIPAHQPPLFFSASALGRPSAETGLGQEES